MTSPSADPGPSDPLQSTADSATLPRRWAALVYELLIVAAVMLIAGFAILPLLDTAGAAGPGGRSAASLQILPPASRAFLLVYYIALLGAYCIVFWTGGRRTVPMKTWRIALRTANGRTLDARDAIKRYVAAWIGPVIGVTAYAFFGRWALLAGFVNYFWAWIDRESLFLHDRIARTRLVRTP